MKVPANFDVQIDVLKQRGFTINDEMQAKKHLKHIGFYRFSYYCNYFLENHNGEEQSFDNVLKYYIFDRKLKLILTDIIERIEVSVKANIIHTLSGKYNDSIFFLKKEIYLDEEKFNSIKTSLESEKSKNKPLKNNQLSQIESWKLFQGFTFGTTTFFYNSLNTQNQKEIADNYDFTNATLSSWLLGLTDMRNICAHYDKLWGIKLARHLSFKHPKLKKLNRETNSIFAYILVMHIFLKEIGIESHFLNNIEDLFNEEEYKLINKAKMGFGANWKNEIEHIVCKS